MIIIKNLLLFSLNLLWRSLSLPIQLILLEGGFSNYIGDKHDLELLLRRTELINLEIEDRLRILKNNYLPDFERYDHSGKNKLKRWVMNKKAPWTQINPPSFKIPGMLT